MQVYSVQNISMGARAKINQFFVMHMFLKFSLRLSLCVGKRMNMQLINDGPYMKYNLDSLVAFFYACTFSPGLSHRVTANPETRAHSGKQDPNKVNVNFRRYLH